MKERFKKIINIVKKKSNRKTIPVWCSVAYNSKIGGSGVYNRKLPRRPRSLFLNELSFTGESLEYL